MSYDNEPKQASSGALRPSWPASSADYTVLLVDEPARASLHPEPTRRSATRSTTRSGRRSSTRCAKAIATRTYTS
ncbi:MAG: hypothetical protein R3E53_10365 [Myxococcota bacterium]